MSGSFGHSFAGFLGLKAYVEKIYADNGFAELKKDISELKNGHFNSLRALR